MADSVIPLCSPAALTEGPFSDLFAGQSDPTISDWLAEATRACEREAGRRLAPFTGLTETHRASAIDPDEYSDSAGLPMDLQSTLGMSYAGALGASNLVRHIWVDQYAPHYQDMWAYTDVSVTIIRSYGGTQVLQPTQILNGPEPDTGHLWFQLGLFLPVGSRAQVTYGGGYTITVPADLTRACKFMTASFALRELDPDDNRHDPDLLYEDALKILAAYER
jgi:hypothetical protein